MKYYPPLLFTLTKIAGSAVLCNRDTDRWGKKNVYTAVIALSSIMERSNFGGVFLAGIQPVAGKSVLEWGA
jgi:hypothetical protein